jgi:tRNA pseudouridine38-40 synthase
LARYQIIIAYDGTRFAGSQRQAESPTVQSELEAALTKIGWQGKSLLLAGRTDSGVHAAGQVAAVDFEWPHTPEDLRNALNSALPPDIAATNISRAPARFHPRFDATSRRYRYRLYGEPVRDPLRDRYAWRVGPGLDGEILQEAALALQGRHDFGAFGTAPRKQGSTARTVMDAHWTSNGDQWTFDVQADAFLYRMVRRMVYVQVAAAQGRLDVVTIRRALEDQRSLLAGLAPARGLTLMEVTYPPFDDLE